MRATLMVIWLVRAFTFQFMLSPGQWFRENQRDKHSQAPEKNYNNSEAYSQAPENNYNNLEALTLKVVIAVVLRI